MRATLEVSQMNAGAEISPIEVRIFKTKSDITIKISDLGGGISRASTGKIFNYMYSTAPQVSRASLSNLPPRLLLSPGRYSCRWWILRSRTLRGYFAHAWLRLRAPTLPALRQIFQANTLFEFGLKTVY